ncbi:MAG: amidohydrolase family protein [Chitinivibrionales bacterium]|nr:amidohydrolase family protein [Chitinivibrionales bacterium]
MATIYYAAEVLLPNAQVVAQGAVAVEGDTIIAAGPRSHLRRSSDDRIVNVGNLLLMPGLINMHTHLEEGVVRGIAPQSDETFASWSAKKNSRLRQAGAAAVRHALELGVRECLAGGTTTVVDSNRIGIAPGILSRQPIRSCAIHEIPALEENPDIALIASLKERIACAGNSPRQTTGVGPYALFSLTPDELRTCQAFAARHGYRWASHISESAEELQAFSEQSGDLYFQITRKQAWPYGKTERGSLPFALENNLIPAGAICFHCNYAGGAELSALAERRCAIVLCLQYNQELGHKPFALESALNRGAAICLGTESIADSPSVNLFDELYTARRLYAHIPAAVLLSWVGANPARALGMQDVLGALSPGFKADFIGVRFAHGAGEDPLEALLNEQPEVRLVVVDGEEIIVNY